MCAAHAGFKAAEGVMEFPTYPPPAVPEGWVAKHTFSSPQGVVAPGAGGSNARSMSVCHCRGTLWLALLDA
jgi:hypothetical protein